jgi:hypothetical protein
MIPNRQNQALAYSPNDVTFLFKKQLVIPNFEEVFSRTHENIFNCFYVLNKHMSFFSTHVIIFFFPEIQIFCDDFLIIENIFHGKFPKQ